MAHKLRSDAEKRDRVFDHMAKFTDKGFATEIPADQVDDPVEGPVWYLPLHIVEKRGKTRPCHDARAATGGICLNDQLLGGPNLINSLHKVLMSFRTKKVAFMTDISAFFHNILVDKRDREAFRYYWFRSKEMREVVCLSLIHI